MHCCWAHFRVSSEAPVAPAIPSKFIYLFFVLLMLHRQLDSSSNIIGIPSLALFSQTRIFVLGDDQIKFQPSSELTPTAFCPQIRFRESILLPAVSFSMASWCVSCDPLTTSQNCILPEQPCNFLNGIGMSFCLRGLRAAFHSCFYFAAASASIFTL